MNSYGYNDATPPFRLHQGAAEIGQGKPVVEENIQQQERYR